MEDYFVIPAFFIFAIGSALSIGFNFTAFETFLCLMLRKNEVAYKCIKECERWYIRLLLVPSCIISVGTIIVIKNDLLSKESFDLLSVIFYTPFALLFWIMNLG
jgi:hypothetical protein